MSYEFIIYGDVRFDICYNDEELEALILSYVRSKINEGSFTYLKLCKSIIETAVKERRLKDARENTYYQSPQLKAKQYTRISQQLWHLILDGKIFIDFYNNEYVARIPNDTTFGINEDAL